MQLVELLLVDDDGLALLAWEHGTLRRRRGYASATPQKGVAIKGALLEIEQAQLPTSRRKQNRLGNSL
jgi:hypothetical protein